MNAQAASARGWLGSLASVFVEPADAAEPLVAEPAVPMADRFVAVAGLRPGAGTTTVARALATELALRDAGRAAFVTADAVGGGAIPLGTPSANRLVRAATRAGADGARAVGRLALVEAQELSVATASLARLAPLVLDLPRADGGELSRLAPHAVVLVASPDCHPALAALVGQSLDAATPFVTVVNRAEGTETDWEGRYDVAVPESRFAAQLALAGREAPGALGRAIGELADRIAVGG